MSRESLDRVAARRLYPQDRENLLLVIARLRVLRDAERGPARNPIDRELNAVRRAFEALYG